MNKIKTFLSITILLIATTACTPTVEVRGKVITDKSVEQLELGATTQRQALSVLGTPTTTSTFDQDVWYYIGQKTERKGIRAAKVSERRVLALTFDDDKVLTGLDELDENDGIALTPSDKETASSGRNFTVLQQLIGNLGRFNGSDLNN